MKATVSIRELREYYQKNHIDQISFCTTAQGWHRVSDSCRINISFPNMLVYEQPAMICLKSGKDTLCIDHIRSVEIDTESMESAIILNVCCGSEVAGGGEIQYTLFANRGEQSF
jgi:hypothetical protein